MLHFSLTGVSGNPPGDVFRRCLKLLSQIRETGFVASRISATCQGTPQSG